MDPSMEGINEELEGLFGDELDGLGEMPLHAAGFRTFGETKMATGH